MTDWFLQKLQEAFKNATNFAFEFETSFGKCRSFKFQCGVSSQFLTIFKLSLLGLEVDAPAIITNDNSKQIDTIF